MDDRRPVVTTVVAFNANEIKGLIASRQGPVWRDIQLRGQKVQNKARRLCPVDKGALKDSITLEMALVNGLPTARIGSNLEYAIFVHEGTGIYGRGQFIKPVRARALRWPSINQKYRQTGGNRRYKSGKTAAYVYSMRSAGSRGRPFLRNALSAAR